jgi:hypothetical protein
MTSGKKGARAKAAELAVWLLNQQVMIFLSLFDSFSSCFWGQPTGKRADQQLLPRIAPQFIMGYPSRKKGRSAASVLWSQFLFWVYLPGRRVDHQRPSHVARSQFHCTRSPFSSIASLGWRRVSGGRSLFWLNLEGELRLTVHRCGRLETTGQPQLPPWPAH